MKLTKQDSLFVNEYLIDFNTHKAAIRAGYDFNEAEAYALMQTPDIKKAIEKAIAVRSKRVGVSGERIIQELARMAFVNPQDIVDKQLSELNEDDAVTISTVKSTVNRYGEVTYEYKFHDKIKALETLMKHAGMLNVKVEGTVEHEHKFDELSDRDLINELSGFLTGIEQARTASAVKSINSNGKARLPNVRSNSKKRISTSKTPKASNK